MRNMETKNITIKLLIDTEANKVVFAEASKDFVDFIFVLLALPMATVIRLLTSESMVGSIAHLYTSFANLDQSYVQPNIHKNFLLYPRIFSYVTDIPLLINKSSIYSPGNLYTCRQCNFKSQMSSTFDVAYCPSCGLRMSSETSSTVIPLTGYVKEMVSYMVSDDLSVTPLSTMSIISMTNKCNASKLEERNVNIGTKEALELLKSSFQSTTVLTDVFLWSKQDKSKAHEVEDAIARLSQELEERNEEIDAVTELNKALITKECMSNDELQDARRELINVFQNLPLGTNVGIKLMGEIELNPFMVACKRKYGAEEGLEVKFLELVSLWQSNIMVPEWHPFKMILKEGKDQQVVDEDNMMLNELRSEWGDDVYNAVVKASKELNECNSSGRSAVKEVWNFKEDRKASVREAIQCLCDQLKNPPAQSDKRRRAM